jgi:hypothetical protein
VVRHYVDGHFVHDLKQDARRVDDQKRDDQMLCVQMYCDLGDLLMGALRDHYVAKMNEYLKNVVLTCVTYQMLALMNENVQILELRYFHLLAFQRVA